MSADPLVVMGLNLLAAVILRLVRPNIATALIMTIVLIGSTGFLGARYGDEVLMTIYQARDQSLTWCGAPPPWPPEKYRAYPDFELLNQDGKTVRLSDFAGRILLVEPIGMSCPASLALAGGHRYGPLQRVAPQANIDALEDYARQYAGVDLNDPRIFRVQILLFNAEMQPPTPADLQDWVRHFRIPDYGNRVVLAGTAAMATAEGHKLVPGVQLVDQRFLLRADATGESPQDNLIHKLLPLLARLLKD